MAPAAGADVLLVAPVVVLHHGVQAQPAVPRRHRPRLGPPPDSRVQGTFGFTSKRLSSRQFGLISTGSARTRLIFQIILFFFYQKIKLMCRALVSNSITCVLEKAE